MPDLIGVDFSSDIIKALERQLNNRGIIIHSAASEADGTHLIAEGLGNKKRTTIIIEKMETQPNDEEAASLVSQYLSSIESGLRTAPMPQEEM